MTVSLLGKAVKVVFGTLKFVASKRSGVGPSRQHGDRLIGAIVEREHDLEIFLAGILDIVAVALRNVVDVSRSNVSVRAEGGEL